MTAQSTADKLRRLQNRVALLEAELTYRRANYWDAWQFRRDVQDYLLTRPPVTVAKLIADLSDKIAAFQQTDDDRFDNWATQDKQLRHQHRAALQAQRAKREKAEAK